MCISGRDSEGGPLQTLTVGLRLARKTALSETPGLFQSANCVIKPTLGEGCGVANPEVQWWVGSRAAVLKGFSQRGLQIPCPLLSESPWDKERNLDHFWGSYRCARHRAKGKDVFRNDPQPSVFGAKGRQGQGGGEATSLLTPTAC